MSGNYTDAVTGEAITYATIAVKGTSIGTHSNFDGLYRLMIVKKIDSLTVSCIGYRTRSFAVTSAAEQTVNVRLEPVSNTLMEVEISPKGYINPTWAIIKAFSNFSKEASIKKIYSSFISG